MSVLSIYRTDKNNIGDTRWGLVCFFHSVFPHPENTGFPVMKNNELDFRKVIDFLASGEVVVTNTYHGAYWATLLGKKVIIIRPFSSKFFYMRHRHIIANEIDVMRLLSKAVQYPEALDECRDANIRFFKKVKEMVG